MRRIISYTLNFRPESSRGEIKLQVEGIAEPIRFSLDATNFAAVAAVLAQKRLAFHEPSGTFVSYDDDTNFREEHLIA